MLMTIYLFRHGETDWNRDRRLQGQSDIPLNDAGRELAMKTAEALKEVTFDAVFSSPLCRAYETAEIIAGKDAEIILDERLKEIDFGECEGQRFDEAKRDKTHLLYNCFCRPERYIPPAGAETFQAAMDRAKEFLEKRILPLEEQTLPCGGRVRNVLIVAHGAFNRALVNPIAGYPIEDFWHIGLANCAATTLTLKNGVFQVLEENRVYYGEAVNARP